MIHQIVLHRQSLNEPGTIIKLESIIDRNSGKVIKKNPRLLFIIVFTSIISNIMTRLIIMDFCRHVPKSTTAIVEIKLPNRPIPLETFDDNKELGRIMLRKGGETIAAGIVKKVIILIEFFF